MTTMTFKTASEAAKAFARATGKFVNIRRQGEGWVLDNGSTTAQQPKSDRPGECEGSVARDRNRNMSEASVENYQVEASWKEQELLDGMNDYVVRETIEIAREFITSDRTEAILMVRSLRGSLTNHREGYLVKWTETIRV